MGQGSGSGTARWIFSRPRQECLGIRGANDMNKTPLHLESSNLFLSPYFPLFSFCSLFLSLLSARWSAISYIYLCSPFSQVLHSECLVTVEREMYKAMDVAATAITSK